MTDIKPYIAIMCRVLLPCILQQQGGTLLSLVLWFVLCMSESTVDGVWHLYEYFICAAIAISGIE